MLYNIVAKKEEKKTNLVLNHVCHKIGFRSFMLPHCQMRRLFSFKSFLEHVTPTAYFKLKNSRDLRKTPQIHLNLRRRAYSVRHVVMTFLTFLMKSSFDY